MTIFELLEQIKTDAEDIEQLCEDMKKPFAGMIDVCSE